MKELDLLIENIQIICSSNLKQEEKIAGIIYEMASGDEDKYNAIVAVLKGDALILNTEVNPNLN